MKLFVLDPHTIYRRGLAASLALMEAVESVAEAATVSEASEHAALRTADLVLLDPSVPAGPDFVRGIRESSNARVIVCASDCEAAEVVAALHAGAVGLLRKDALTPEALAAAIRAAADGAGVVSPELLSRLLRPSAPEVADPLRFNPTQLTDRELRVLSLIADGHPTREVAHELSYSERTVKNVLHDVVTKLKARSRSQAVAFAVREGLI